MANQAEGVRSCGTCVDAQSRIYAVRGTPKDTIESTRPGALSLCRVCVEYSVVIHGEQRGARAAC